MEKLLQMVEEEAVWLDYDDLTFLPRTTYGLYFVDPESKSPHIILDKGLEKNLPLHRSVLAEELGHYFTVPQTNFLVPYTSYSLQLLLSRDEEKALRWACDFLIPELEFMKAVENGVQEVEEIADYFTVTKFLVMRRIHFLNCTYTGNDFLLSKKLVAPSFDI